MANHAIATALFTTEAGKTLALQARRQIADEQKKAREAMWKANADAKKAKRAAEIEAQRKARAAAIADRIRELSGMAYDLFMANVPSGQKRHPDYFFHAKETVRKLGVRGGSEYENVLTTVKYAMVDPKAYLDAVHTLIPPVKA
jgi:hypothetical protein